MLINNPAVALIIGFSEPPKEPIAFPAEETEELKTVRGIWIQLIEWARNGDISPLLRACQRTLFPDRLNNFLDALDGKKKPRSLGGFMKPFIFTERIKGEPAKVYNEMVASILYYNCFLGGNRFEWSKIKVCTICQKYFLKVGRRRFCSERCSNQNWQRPYNPERDKERQRLYQRARWLAKEKGYDPKEIKRRLIEKYGKKVVIRYEIDRWKLDWDSTAQKFR